MPSLARLFPGTFHVPFREHVVIGFLQSLMFIFARKQVFLRKSRWMRWKKKVQLIALLNLPNYGQIESVHRRMGCFTTWKSLALNRCQTGKDFSSLTRLKLHNEASSICMAHPIWSRDGENFYNCCAATAKRRFLSRNSKRRGQEEDARIINYVAHAAVNRRAWSKKSWKTPIL